MASDSGGRRAGDWTHKGQRTHEKANTIVKGPGAKRWYEDNFWIIFLKVVVSVVLAGVVLLSFSMWSAGQASMA